MPRKRLYRSERDKILLGVCGGLGEYFGVDPIIFRILFIVAIVFEPRFIIVYILLAIVMPRERRVEVKEGVEVAIKEISNEKARAILAYALIAIGLILLLKDLISLAFYQIVGIVLIALGILVVLRGERA